MGKKVLVVGSGGREHALAWKLAQSPLVSQIFVAPGNAGTNEMNIPLAADDIPGIVDFAQTEQISLTVVGSEEPLSLGLVDALNAAGCPAFGPTKKAAQLEVSKAFAKQVMSENNIPTAKYEVFDDLNLAKAYLNTCNLPCVIKADGLAAGKGVLIAYDRQTARDAIDQFINGTFGQAGHRVVIEEFLTGPEVSFLCLCDGKTALPLAAVQDHKRVFDHDKGPNTGGMGTFSPPPVWNNDLENEVMQNVVEPLLEAMNKQGTPFYGVLFIGLMLTNDGPRILEFNVRFGDPETQVVLLRLKSDLYPLLEACTQGNLAHHQATWSTDAAVCIVLAAPGYPGNYEQGLSLKLPPLEAGEMVFQAGTKLVGGELVNSGGRVLGACASGLDLSQAQKQAYRLVERIEFPRCHYRTDIGKIYMAT